MTLLRKRVQQGFHHCSSLCRWYHFSSY